MSLIDSVRTYLATYSGLATGAPLSVDHLGQSPTEYSIVPLPGSRIVETYLNGATLREYPFAIQSTESTADDPERIDNNEFYEDLAAWLETQTEAGTLPTLDSGKTALTIEALGWGYISEQGDATAIYLIQCKLTFEQDP